MNDDCVRELSLEEMIALDYDTKFIKEALNAKLKKRDAEKLNAEKQALQDAARRAVIQAVKEYLTILGVPAAQLDSSTLDEIFKSFEKEIEPALKVFGSIPSKKQSRSTLDEVSLETALGALRTFADSL